jgi:hypothetical protein
MNLTPFAIPFVAVALAGCATSSTDDNRGQDAYDRNTPTNVNTPDAPNQNNPPQNVGGHDSMTDMNH